MSINNLSFGYWSDKINYLNTCHFNIANRIEMFVKDMPNDPYKRTFNAEKIIEFALAKGITNFSIEYIYKQLIYSKLSLIENINIYELELFDEANEFIHL
jgi:hypothetical protein